MADNYWTRRQISRRRFTAYGAGAGLALGGMAIAGCGDDDDKPTATKAATSGPSASAAASASASAAASAPASATAAVKRGGTITVNGVNGLDAPHLDVHQTNTQLLSSYGVGMAYSRLFRYKVPPETASGWNADTSPDLAASSETPDTTTVVVKIRPNAKFHNIAPVNGRPATAQDVVYSFNRQIQFKTNATLLPPWETMEATDGATVRFKLKAPNADFIPTLAVYQNKVIAKEAVDAGKGGDLKEGPTIGTGPWILEEWKSGQTTKLKKNPDYFIQGQPYADNFVWLRIPEPATALAALKTGQIQHMSAGVTYQTVEEVKGDKSISVSSGSRFGDSFLNFKMDSPPFNDLRVRQAVYRAINYDQLIQVANFGQGYYGGGISLPALDWQLPEADLKAIYKFDLNEAKQLLSAAGATNLSFDLGVQNFSPYDKQATLIQQQLKAVNIDVKIVLLDNVGYAANALSPANKYPLMFGPSSPSPLPTADLQPKFYTGGSRNGSGLKDAKLDGMIDKQAAALDAKERKALLMDLQKYFHENRYQWSLGSIGFALYATVLQGANKISLSEPDSWTRSWIDKA